jgi:hypothetical protein
MAVHTTIRSSSISMLLCADSNSSIVVDIKKPNNPPIRPAIRVLTTFFIMSPLFFKEILQPNVPGRNIIVYIQTDKKSNPCRQTRIDIPTSSVYSNHNFVNNFISTYKRPGLRCGGLCSRRFSFCHQEFLFSKQRSASARRFPAEIWWKNRVAFPVGF